LALNNTIQFKRNLIFLKDIAKISLTAFGGPEMHIALFQKKFVEQRANLTTKELIELNSLCQILPGPSSTQTLIAIAFKMGGPGLAFLSLLIWVFPAAVLMSGFAILTSRIDIGIFKFIAPMAIAFVGFSALKMTKLISQTRLSYLLILISMVVSFVFHTPYLFPILLVFGAFINVNFGIRNFIPNNTPLLKIRWANLTLMLSILVFAALVGWATKNNFPSISEPIRLFENVYRMGSMVFGGGNVLYSMILTEFVEFKQKQYLTYQEFTTGVGLLQAVPGPTFTIATYSIGIAMKKMGYDIWGQLVGCGIGTFAVFLPGTLLIFFVYPIWGKIKAYPIVYRSLDGIIATSIGFLWSSVFLMAKGFLDKNSINSLNGTVSLLIFACTIIVLKYLKVPPIFIVLITVLIGFLIK